MESQRCSKATKGQLPTGLIHGNQELIILPTEETGHHHYICRICSCGERKTRKLDKSLGVWKIQHVKQTSGDEPVQRVTDGEIFCLRCRFGLHECWKDAPWCFPYRKMGINTITDDSFVMKLIQQVLELNFGNQDQITEDCQSQTVDCVIKLISGCLNWLTNYCREVADSTRTNNFHQNHCLKVTETCPSVGGKVFNCYWWGFSVCIEIVSKLWCRVGALRLNSDS